MFILSNRVAYGLLEVLRPDRISGLGLVLRLFSAPLPKYPDSRSPSSSPRKRGSRGGRTGKQGGNPGETRNQPQRPGSGFPLSHDKQESVFGLECAKLLSITPPDSFKEPPFSILRLKDSGAPPPSIIAAKAGLRLDPNVKESFKTIHPTLPPFTPHFCKRLS